MLNYFSTVFFIFKNNGYELLKKKITKVDNKNRFYLGLDFTTSYFKNQTIVFFFQRRFNKYENKFLVFFQNF